jgi:two-component system OmpR family response regulator
MSHAAAVLVADDDRDCADSVVTLLQMHGFEARAAYDGRSALELAQEWRPATAILDIVMPGASGLDVALRLRETRGDDIHLVAYTGRGEIEHQSKAVAAGFDDFLSKSCDPADLLLVLRPESRDTVLRSMAVNAHQIGLQMDLAGSLIDHARLTVDHTYRRRLCEFVDHRLDLLDSQLGLHITLQLEREKLERRLNALRDRLFAL